MRGQAGSKGAREPKQGQGAGQKREEPGVLKKAPLALLVAGGGTDERERY